MHTPDTAPNVEIAIILGSALTVYRNPNTPGVALLHVPDDDARAFGGLGYHADDAQAEAWSAMERAIIEWADARNIAMVDVRAGTPADSVCVVINARRETATRFNGTTVTEVYPVA